MNFEELYQQHYKSIYSFVMGRLRNTTETDDVVQETFIRLWRALEDKTIEDRNINAWLCTVALHIILDQKKHAALPAHPGRLDDWAEIHFAYDGWEQVITRLDIQAALAHIPKACQAVFYWYYYKGLPESIIAERCGKTKSMIHANRTRGLRYFARYYLHHAWQPPPKRVTRKCSNPTSKKGKAPRYVFLHSNSRKPYQVAIYHPVTKHTHYLGYYATQDAAIAIRDRFCQEQGIAL